MGLIHANLCTSCGNRRTKDPSGICCRCRRLSLRTSCLICGSKTKAGQFCSECRKRLETQKNLDVAISEQQQRLNILKLRKEGSRLFSKGNQDYLRDCRGIQKQHPQKYMTKLAP